MHKHDCGALLCRECIWESKKCPYCQGDVKPGKGAIKPRAPRAPKAKTAEMQAPARQPDPRPIDDDNKPDERRRPRLPSQDDDSADMPAPRSIVKVPAERGELARTEEGDTKARARRPPAKEPAEDGNDDDDGQDAQPESDGADRPQDIYDDDLQPRRRSKAGVPLYKRRRHAAIPKEGEDGEDEESGDGEEEDDGKGKKKWDVRTVPPAQPRKGYDSL